MMALLDRNDTSPSASVKPLMLAWIGACLLGGTLAALSVEELGFAGWFFIYGLAIGTAQAVVWRWLTGSTTAAVEWATRTVLGWLIGAVLTAFAQVHVLFFVLPWLLVGLSQALGVGQYVLRSGRDEQTWPWLLRWFLAAGLGGSAGALLGWAASWTAAYDALQEGLGVSLMSSLRDGVCLGLLYGLPTGLVLGRLFRNGRIQQT